MSLVGRTAQVRAPAKVNLRLDVLRRRPDGYHELRMIMQRIDLCDELRITLRDMPGIRVTCGRTGVPDGPGNIAWRAADALLTLSGEQVGIDIALTKHIPVAAGLGGGSSDCASVLLGLNELLGLRLDTEKLMEVGVKLGADVPFFIYGHNAIAGGIGEKLSPVTLPTDMWLVLVNPNIHVSTAWVYQNLQLTSSREETTIPCFYGSIADVCAILANDLEKVTMQRFPVLGRIKESLSRAGARGTLMSGSGPTVFGIFDDGEAARQACTILKKNDRWFVTAAKALTG